MEKEKLNLAEILKDAPKGTKLWSPICGECELKEVIDLRGMLYPIAVRTFKDGLKADFTSDGRYDVKYKGECMLFPSKEQRDWDKFEAPKKKVVTVLGPGSPVLVRDNSNERWHFNVFSHIDNDDPEPSYVCVFETWMCCIPYNVDTCHLINTGDPCPIDYEIKFEKEV